MKTIYSIVQDLILIEEYEPVHEGHECGEGYCTEQCITDITVRTHNDAVLYLKSVYGLDNQ